MNWHKIDWEKINKIFEPIAELDSYDELYWDHLVVKGLKLDGNGNMIGNWENFLNANLPIKDKKYLLYWGDDESFLNNDDYDIGYFSSEETPYFAQLDRTPFYNQPSHWCELEEPE
jgi:hypothetical protein